MPSDHPQQLFEGYWKRVCAKVRRPLSGLRLPDAAVVEIAERVFEEFCARYRSLPPRAEIAKFLLGRAAEESLQHAAEARAEAGDPQLYHDPEEGLYEHNLDLTNLRRQAADGRFDGAEWERLPGVLHGRAWSVLRRLGVREAEFEDLFLETLAALALVRDKGRPAPVQQLTVFEEIVPLFTTMIHNRGVSWLRKQSAQRNRPNNPAYSESLDDPDRHLEPASVGGADPEAWGGLSFERIHEACRDCLDDLEWHILTVLFVEASATRGDLANDPWVLEQMGVAANSSMGNRRRHLNSHLQAALDKLGNCLRTRDV